jgi:hypothetical protein
MTLCLRTRALLALCALQLDFLGGGAHLLFSGPGLERSLVSQHGAQRCDDEWEVPSLRIADPILWMRPMEQIPSAATQPEEGRRSEE